MMNIHGGWRIARRERESKWTDQVHVVEHSCCGRMVSESHCLVVSIRDICHDEAERGKRSQHQGIAREPTEASLTKNDPHIVSYRPQRKMSYLP